MNMPTTNYSQYSMSSNITSYLFKEENCKIYSSSSNDTVLNDYEGIPENLLINVSVWLGAMILFTFIRRIGNYGRFGLINIKNKKGDETKDENEEVIDTVYVRPNNFGSKNSLASQEIPQSKEFEEKHIFSWIVHMFKLKDKHIKQKCGDDAIHYLVFQRYLIVYMLIITILSISVLLPINLYGSDTVDYRSFASATIVNIKLSYNICWVHVAFSWFYMVLGFIFIWHFTRKYKYSEADYTSRTVLITNYPKEFRNEEVIHKHIEEAYPELKIHDIQFVYNLNKIAELERKLHSILVGKRTSQKMFDSTGERPQMYTFHCGNLVQLCSCGCCKQKKIDSIDYYIEEEGKLCVKIEETIESTSKKPMGVLFITFQNQKMAELFIRYYFYSYLTPVFHSLFGKKKSCLKCFLCKHLPKGSSVSNQIASTRWFVKYAPAHNNIKWVNLSKSGVVWWLKLFLINVVFIVLIIFFTSPSIIIEKLAQPFENNSTNVVNSNNYVNGFLPTLLIRLIQGILPIIVAYTSVMESHWTNSAETRSALIKTYVFFLFSVLILPTFGLTSIDRIFVFVVNKMSSAENFISDDKWRCVSYNGAFFVKYVTTCTFIGLSLEIVRLFDLFLYLLKLLWAKSALERQAVRKKVVFEFYYGFQYAQLLIVFTVSLCFCVVCPLITPFCLVFLIAKQFVDRYNIYFSYISTKVDRSIHDSAVTFTVFSIILLQICVFLFIAVRKNGNVSESPFAIAQLVIISILVVVFIGRLSLGTFERLWNMIFFKKLKNFLINEHAKTSNIKKPDIVITESPERSKDITSIENYKLQQEGKEENSLRQSMTSIFSHSTQIALENAFRRSAELNSSIKSNHTNTSFGNNKINEKSFQTKF